MWWRFRPRQFNRSVLSPAMKYMRLQNFIIPNSAVIAFCLFAFTSVAALASLDSFNANKLSALSKQRTKLSADTDLPKPSSVLKSGLEQNNYLAPLLELRSREAQYLASKELRADYLETMTLLCSYVGEFDAAYSYEEMFLSDLDARNKSRERNSKDLTSSPIDDYKPLNALAAIASASDGQQVIMINEEH